MPRWLLCVMTAHTFPLLTRRQRHITRECRRRRVLLTFGRASEYHARGFFYLVLLFVFDLVAVGGRNCQKHISEVALCQSPPGQRRLSIYIGPFVGNTSFPLLIIGNAAGE